MNEEYYNTKRFTATEAEFDAMYNTLQYLHKLRRSDALSRIEQECVFTIIVSLNSIFQNTQVSR